MKNTKISYLTQYCNMLIEWHTNGLKIDDIPENQMLILKELHAKAVEQSGLTSNELTLICMCRKYRVFDKVNMYAHKIKKVKY